MKVYKLLVVAIIAVLAVGIVIVVEGNGNDKKAPDDTYNYSIDYVLMKPEAVNDYRNPISYNHEMFMIKFFPATCPGYTFKGWYMDSGYTEPVPMEIEAASITGSFTLFAKWA